jgi:spore coat protein A
VIDFSKLAGKTIIMKNDANAPVPTDDPDDPQTTGQTMECRVSKPLDTTNPDATLKANSEVNRIIPFKGKDVTTTRQLGLFETTDEYGRLIQKLGAVDPTKGEIVPYDFMNTPKENVQLVQQPDGTSA